MNGTFLLVLAATALDDGGGRGTAARPRGLPAGVGPPFECGFDADHPTRIQPRRQELDLAIRGLDDGADPSPVVARLEGLVSDPCYRTLGELSPLPKFPSARALVTWWQNGGQYWLMDDLPQAVNAGLLTLPPDGRTVLALEGNEQHRLAPLLCRGRDRHCGVETAGWLARADALLAVAQDRSEAQRRRYFKTPPPPSCEHPQGDTADARYLAWRTCVEGDRPRRWYALPLGRFRAPSLGWLVITGRRGHYEFSDELGAYDLATGAAYRVRRDGDLGILPPRDAAALARRRTGKRPLRVDRGHVALDGLREAALILLLWPEAQRDVALRSHKVKLPPGLELRPRTAGPPPAAKPTGEYSTSGDTALRWTWVAGDGHVLASDQILHDPGLERVGGYPSWLLSLAEASFDAGCPEARPPVGVFGTGTSMPGVSPIDADVDSTDETRSALKRALGEAASAPCAPATDRR